jgi:hypothetical protein
MVCSATSHRTGAVVQDRSGYFPMSPKGRERGLPDRPTTFSPVPWASCTADILEKVARGRRASESAHTRPRAVVSPLALPWRARYVTSRTPLNVRAITRCCSSSVVEHSLGKGEVESSILSCSTMISTTYTNGMAHSHLAAISCRRAAVGRLLAAERTICLKPRSRRRRPAIASLFKLVQRAVARISARIT